MPITWDARRRDVSCQLHGTQGGVMFHANYMGRKAAGKDSLPVFFLLFFIYFFGG